MRFRGSGSRLSQLLRRHPDGPDFDGSSGTLDDMTEDVRRRPFAPRGSGRLGLVPGRRKRDGCPRRRRLRFGDFEFDPGARELIGPAGVVRLQPQPARLLELLLERSGDVVSRETVRRHLWRDKIHVEFDQGMNTCVKRIRSALNDRAEAPRYIETLPRLGYRFLEPVTEIGGGGGLLGIRGGTRRGRFRLTMLAILLAVGLAIGIASLAAWRAFVPSPCSETETATRPGEASVPRAASGLRGPRGEVE